jgi:hypothetical protein
MLRWFGPASHQMPLPTSSTGTVGAAGTGGAADFTASGAPRLAVSPSSVCLATIRSAVVH